MKATAIRLVLAATILAAFGFTTGGAALASVSRGGLTITSLCSDGPLYATGSFTHGDGTVEQLLGGTLLARLKNTGTAPISGWLYVAFTQVDKGAWGSLNTPVLLKPGKTIEVRAQLEEIDGESPLYHLGVGARANSGFVFGLAVGPDPAQATNAYGFMPQGIEIPFANWNWKTRPIGSDLPDCNFVG